MTPGPGTHVQVGGMENNILKVESIRKDIEFFKRRCEGLAEQFEASEIVSERMRLADEYSRALEQVEAQQLLLELLERQEGGRGVAAPSLERRAPVPSPAGC